MNKHTPLFISLLIISGLTLAACGQTPAPVTQEDKSTKVETPVVPTKTPFAEVGKGIMDAKEDFKYFAFEEGTGDCLDKENFPTNLIYTKDNMIKTSDNNFGDDYTSVTAGGYINFKGIPLKSGKAACEVKALRSTGKGEVTCSIDEKPICTAIFTLFGYK